MNKRFPWTDSYSLESSDVDRWQRLRLSAAARFLQETAWNHAKELKIDYSQGKFADIHWVLTRLDIHITGELPQWGDEVLVHTQALGVDKMLAVREFLLECRNSGGAREFCRSTSSWVIIDAESRRIQKPQAYVEGIVLPEAQPILPNPAPRIQLPEDSCWGTTLQVHPAYNEIDLHGHVNNGKYLEWFFAHFQQEHFERWVPQRICLNFSSEILWGDSTLIQFCSSRSAPNNLDTLHQALSSTKALGKPACIGTIRWQPRVPGATQPTAPPEIKDVHANEQP